MDGVRSPGTIAVGRHSARQARGITRYELGRQSKAPSTTVRAIENGDDVPLSQQQAVAEVLGLTIKIVHQAK